MDIDEGTCIFGSGVLLKHRQALADEIEAVQSGEEGTDPVHDARVASRRLRATFPLFEDCLPTKKAKKWLKQIRNVTRALGEARDTDVQLEWLEKAYKALPEPRYQPGVRRLMLRLRQRREKLQAPLTRSMEKLVDSAILEAMREKLEPIAAHTEDTYMYTPALYQHSFEAITGHLKTFLSFNEFVYQPEKATELHQMRIAAKWLRYTMETFAPLYADQLTPYLQAVRTAQELLGEIHDCDVWQSFLPQFLEEERQRILDYFGEEAPLEELIPGIQYLENERQQDRGEYYEQFLSAWQSWQETGLWNSLRRALQVPFPKPSEVYPPLTPQPVPEKQ